MASDPRKQHYQQFLAGLILAILAGTATIWWLTGFFLAMSYFSGAATVLVFTYVAPTYVAPESETDADHEPEKGYQ